jgi:hypothetical protein
VPNIVYGDPTVPDGNFDKVARVRPLNVVVFSPHTPGEQTFSERITIPLGKAYFFRAHDVPDGKSIFINGVSLAASVPLGGGGCFPPEGYCEGPDLRVQRMTLGGADKWVLTAEFPQVLVNLPGIYRLELESPDMLGDLYVEYTEFLASDRLPFMGAMK